MFCSNSKIYFRDLDMKKKALYLEIVERKEYLEQRGAEIYQKWDVLKEFI